MIEAEQNIFRKFLHNSYMFSECLNEMIFIKYITELAGRNTPGQILYPHETAYQEVQKQYQW
jgi:hypothetical protein